MEIIKKKSFEKAIIFLKILNDGKLAVVDSHSVIRLLNTNTLIPAAKFKINVQHLRYKASVVTLSNDGKYFATLTSDCKVSKLYNMETTQCIATVDRHHGEASCVGIDPLSRYMFSCGEDGKSFAIDVKSGKLVFTLPTHVDTVNDIAFSANSNWVATASYDKKISLFNLVTMTRKEKFKGHIAPIMKLRFLTKNRLLSVDKNSSAFIWNIHSGKVVARLQGVHDDVISITTSNSDKFLFLGTSLGYVLLYDLDSYALLSPKYVKINSAITAMEFDKQNKHLLIGSEDGFLMSYDIYEGEENLKILLKNKQFEAMQERTKINPILAKI